MTNYTTPETASAIRKQPCRGCALSTSRYGAKSSTNCGCAVSNCQKGNLIAGTALANVERVLLIDTSDPKTEGPGSFTIGAGAFL